MNIRGAVTEAKRQVPIAGAKVILAIGDREFATTSTNNLGRFEHREDENFPGQTLTCTVEKEKFETAVIQHPIESEVINLAIPMQPEKAVTPSAQPRTDGNDNRAIPVAPYSPTTSGNDKLSEALKKHWAKIFAGIALLILIGVGLSTCSRPSIKTFSASSLNVKRGEKVKLTWETAKASLVTLNGAKVALSGSTDVTPTETRPYSYELRAKNDYGGSQKHLVVTVIPAAAPIVKFWVEPQQVEKNETAVLHWETTGATQVRINHGKVGVSGRQEVTPHATQTYTLVAENEDGEKTESLTLKVAPEDTATSSGFKLGFKATRNRIGPGEDTTLSWDTGAVKDVELKQGDQPPQKVPSKGEVKVNPSGTTTYILTGYPPTGPPISKRVNIRVATPIPPPTGTTQPEGTTPPQVNGKLRAIFTAQPISIQQGQATQLTWKVENAKEVKFKAEGESEKSLPLMGSMQVTPNAPTTYTLSARSESGQTVKKTVTVSVRVTNDAASCSTSGEAQEAEVIKRAGRFIYVLRIQGKECTGTGDSQSNIDSNIGAGTPVTVRAVNGRIQEMKPR